jgi:2-polyprenyl-3-methyl-5-hydroxy-6-metoxy-1,4-benzoquinol methylase
MRFVDSPPADADAWREVWQDDRRYRPRPARFDWLFRFVRRLIGRATEAEAERQKNFNVVVIDLLGDLRRDVAALRDDLKADLAAVQGDVQRADEALAGDVAKIRELLPVAARRNDALIAALDQKIESVAARLRDVTNPLLAGAPEQTRSDFLYRRLEDGLRGSEAEVRASIAPYVELAKTHAPLIDVGCGRGELLLACREAGIEARGFDTNERSVADLRARGADTAVAGVPECFAAIADASVGTVVAMHVVEHLPVELLFALYRESARVLRPGGLLIVETPNAEAFAVTASEFWRDPTHLAPRHPAALVLLAREHGFAVEEVRAIHPFPEGNRFTGEDRRLVDALNERFFGGQDLRLILRKG